MSRRSRLALKIAGSLLGLVVLVALAGLYIARSPWLRDQVRQRIIAEVERASGGRVEIGAFQFDWNTLTAQLTDFVIHGTEPAGSPPLLRIRSIDVQLKVISFLKKAVDIESVDAAQPQAHLIINPDGTTNVPVPKVRTSTKNPVAEILDLAIRRFLVRDGMFQVNSQRTPWNASGENLHVQLSYNRGTPSYTGDLSVQPLHFIASQDLPVDLAVKISLAIERNRLLIPGAHIETSRSHADLTGSIDSFSSPEYRLQYTGSVSLEELVRTLRFRARPQGILHVSGAASFRDFSHYLIAGKFSGDSLTFGQGKVQIRSLRAESEFRVDPQKIDLTGVRLAALDGTFHGSARIQQLDRISVEGEAENFDLQRIAQAFALGPLPWDGVLSGPVTLNGLISEFNQGRLTAHAQLVVSPATRDAPVRGVIDANYDGYQNSVDLGRSFLQLPFTRLDFAGTLGRQLRVRLQSSDLNDLLPALRMMSNSSHPVLPIQLQNNGSASFTGTVTGSLSSPQISGHAALQKFTCVQQNIDSFSADLSARDSGLRVQNGSLARGNLRVQYSGTVGLHNWTPENGSEIAGSASLRGGDIQDLLSLAAKGDIPASGTLSGTAQVNGTLGEPRLSAVANVTRGSLFGEPFDLLSAHLAYDDKSASSDVQIDAAGKRLTFSASYAHAPNDLRNGRVVFEISTNGMPLDQFQLAWLHQLPFAGAIQFTAKGSGAVTASQNGSTAFRLTELQAKLEGQDIQLAQRPVGAVHLTAATAGSVLTAQLQSAVANSIIRADGQWRLEGDYPGSAQISFSKLDLASLESWLGLPSSAPQVSGSVEGKAIITGPALKPEAWTGTLEIPQLEIAPQPGTGSNANLQSLALHNEGPIRLGLQNQAVRVESARLVGQSTDIALTGTVSFKEKNPLDLRVNGNVDLAILRDFSSDVVASGKVAVNAAVLGPVAQPLVNGRLELHNANLNVATFPNGLSNANGVIVFSGNRATIQNLAAESGGGKVTVTGSATRRADITDLNFEIAADQVRLRYPEGVSTLANAKLTWTGTSQRSLASGNVTILRTGFTPRTDLVSILATSTQPANVPAVHTGLLAGINFDVQIDTSPDISVRSEIAQQIQVEANLRLRGTPNSPVLLGRINITQGQLIFFGTKFTIGQATISFFNPVKIEPIVNLDLQTKARGVDVTITISGPMSKLNVTYRSDPPLQFTDIVALLATGRAPTSDPTLAASQAGAAQTWQQLGASALVGQALASPVSGRLQRFFGVSKIKIDPTLTGITNPQARLTIEQQVTPDITFTYITYLTQSNPQVIQVEWSLNKQVSLVALRDENGLFGLDFYYKKRFK